MDKLYLVKGLKYVPAKDKFDAATQYLAGIEMSDDEFFYDVVTEEAKGYLFEPTEQYQERKVGEKGTPINDEKEVLKLCLARLKDKEYQENMKAYSHVERIMYLLSIDYDILEEEVYKG